LYKYIHYATNLYTSRECVEYFDAIVRGFLSDELKSFEE
jgi:hypothetical protein